ncbi:MAG: Holliday junction resolvase RuvX [Acidobacteriota bacterium]
MASSSTSWPGSGRLLAVDPGTKRLGLAISDPLRMIACPFRTIDSRGRRKDLEAIARIVGEEEVVGVIVGLPINMDGTRGPECEKAERFIEELRTATGLPVRGWDERLTSAQAERALVEAGVRRERRRREGLVDRTAAALLLESFLAAAPPDERDA